MRNRQLIFTLVLTLLLHPVMPSQAQTPKLNHLPRATRTSAIAPIRSFPFPGLYSVYAMSPDGTMVAIALQNTIGPSTIIIHIWRLRDGRLFKSFSSHGKVDDIAFSPDSKSLAILNDTPETLPNSGDWFKGVSLWNLRSGKRLFQISHLYLGEGLAFSPDSRTLAFGYTPYHENSGEVVSLVSARTGHVQKVLPVSLFGAVAQIAFSSNGYFIAAISTGTEAGTAAMALWHRTGKPYAYSDNASFFEVGYLFFMDDGRTVINANKIVQYHHGRLMVTSIQLRKDNDYFMLCPIGKSSLLCYRDTDGAIIRWDIASSRHRRVCDLKDGKSFDFSLSTRSNGKLVAGVKHDRIFIWRLPSLRSRMRSHK